MDSKGDTQCNQNFHSKIYQEVIHIDDVEVIAHFMISTDRIRRRLWRIYPNGTMVKLTMNY